MTRAETWRPLPILAALVLLAYAGSWRGAFQFDDFNVIVYANGVHSLAAWWDGLGRGLRPLLKLSYLLNGAIDPQPFGFHLFNLLVHVFCSYLVYLLARQVGAVHAAGRDWHWVAGFAAAWFALHPVHTEAVTYISGRATSLMTLLYLAALYAYTRGHRGLALGWFVLALLVKESALLLPAALLLWEAIRGTPWRTILRRQWPWWLLAGLAVLLVVLHPGYRQLLGNSLAQHASGSAAWTQLNAAFYLLGQWIWPSRLNIDPELPRIVDFTAVSLQALGSALLIALSWHWRRTRPWVGLAIGWLLLHLWLFNALLPRSDIANERSLYWADWALFVALLAELHTRLPRPWFIGIGLGVALLLAACTWQRNLVYRSELALWTDTVLKSPHKARVWNNLGYALAEAGQREAALRAYQQALRLDPGYVKAINNRDHLLQQSDQ